MLYVEKQLCLLETVCQSIFLQESNNMEPCLQKADLRGYSLMHFLQMIFNLKIGKNAIETAAVLKAGLKEKGYTFYIDSPTNQQFVVLENRKMEELKKRCPVQLLGEEG